MGVGGVGSGLGVVVGYGGGGLDVVAFIVMCCGGLGGVVG